MSQTIQEERFRTIKPIIYKEISIKQLHYSEYIIFTKRKPLCLSTFVEKHKGQRTRGSERTKS